jgi:hypothetical protein
LYSVKIERPTISPARSPSELRPLPSDNVMTPFLSVAHSTMGAASITARRWSSVRQSASSASRRSVTSFSTARIASRSANAIRHQASSTSTTTPSRRRWRRGPTVCMGPPGGTPECKWISRTRPGSSAASQTSWSDSFRNSGRE